MTTYTVAPLTFQDMITWFEKGQHAPESFQQRETVSLFDHGMQCAEVLAAWHPEDMELQVAGLLHDLGHHFLIGATEHSENHEFMHGIEGGDSVRQLFGDRVADLIELHVPAKRYLVSFDPLYADILSSVSTYTLERQGGPMNDEERAQHEAMPLWEDALQLRRADDMAKTPNAPTRPFDHWVAVMQQLTTERVLPRAVEKQTKY